MLIGRGGFESPRALDGVDGERGEAWPDASNFWTEVFGVTVSIGGGLLAGDSFSPDGDGLGL